MPARWLVIFFVALGVIGCSPKVIKVSSTSNEVVVNHTPERRQDADRLAAATCAEYGRNTRLRYRHDQYARMDQFGVYDCLPR